MTLQMTNTDLLKNAYDAFAKGDLETVLAFYHDDIEFTEPRGMAVFGGTYHGQQAVVEDMFAHIPERFEEIQLVPSAYIEQGPDVVVLGNYKGKGKNGVALDARFAHTWRIEDGHAVRFEGIADTALYNKAVE